MQLESRMGVTLDGALITFPATHCRVPNTPECFSWTEGNTSILERGFDVATSAPGSVLVSRSGHLNATSAYGYTYNIDFVGQAVRGDMDMRLLVAETTVDGDFAGDVDAVFNGLGESSSVEASLSGDLDNVTYTDATVQLM